MVRRIPAPFSRAFARRVSSTTSGEPAAAADDDEEDKAATARSTAMSRGAAAETTAKPDRRCERSGVRGVVALAIARAWVLQPREAATPWKRDCQRPGWNGIAST